MATRDPAVVGTLMEGFARSWAGATPEEFDAQVRDWTRTVKQPDLGVPVFVCSGGGRDFMRVFAEEAWGIYRRT